MQIDPNKTIDICGIGNAIVDSIFNVEDTDLESLSLTKGQMSLIDDTELSRMASQFEAKSNTGGGAVANALVSASQLGACCVLSAKVGDDKLGNIYINDLNQAGVKTAFKPISDAKTGQCLGYITKDAQRTMATYLGITGTYKVEDIAISSIKEAHWLLLEGYLLFSPHGVAALQAACAAAKSYHTKIALSVADPSVASVCKEAINSLIELGLDLIFCNKEEAHALTDEENISDSLNTLSQRISCVVITDGKNGAWAKTDKEHAFCEALNVDAIDTIGAGDSFAGTFLAHYHLNNNLKAALSAANQKAASIVQVVGARL